MHRTDLPPRQSCQAIDHRIPCEPSIGIPASCAATSNRASVLWIISSREYDARILCLALRLLYSRAHKYLVNCFFDAEPVDPGETEVFPPLVNPAVKAVHPVEGDYALVYQTSPTFEGVLDALARTPRKFVIYGFGDRAHYRNLVFRGPSRRNFVHDLAGCRYAITNGSHNVISEALFIGKPVLALPIVRAYEQIYNAHMLASKGYGAYCLGDPPGPDDIERFEDRIDDYRGCIVQGDFYGNGKLASHLERLIEEIR